MDNISLWLVFMRAFVLQGQSCDFSSVNESIICFYQRFDIYDSEWYVVIFMPSSIICVGVKWGYVYQSVHAYLHAHASGYVFKYACVWTICSHVCVYSYSKAFVFAHVSALGYFVLGLIFAMSNFRLKFSCVTWNQYCCCTLCTLCWKIIS